MNSIPLETQGVIMKLTCGILLKHVCLPLGVFLLFAKYRIMLVPNKPMLSTIQKIKY